MPDEPLIFVEVALNKGIPGSVQTLLAQDRKARPEAEADTAVFYSISNCQPGLASISFGNSWNVNFRHRAIFRDARHRH